MASMRLRPPSFRQDIAINEAVTANVLAQNTRITSYTQLGGERVRKSQILSATGRGPYSTPMFDGSFVALVTPFQDGKVDLKKLADLVTFHLENGTQGIVPAATTGEAPTLSRNEKYDVIRTVVRGARRKATVIAGAGTNDTRTTIELTRMTKEAGADAALLVTPYYNKPTQEGLFRHYEAVANAVDLPIVIYNVPSRTGVGIAPETTARLSKMRNIVALKDSSGSIEHVTQVRALCDICILSGEDALTYPILCLGGRGVISVAANIIPKAVRDLYAQTIKGNLRRANDLHRQWYDLFKTLFIETNPIPVKAAMNMMGLLNGELRLPLCEMSPSNAARLKACLKAHRLIRR